MMSNQTIINNKIPHQIPHQQQRNRYRSNERTNLSPNINNNNNINNINIIKTKNISNNNNIYYINPKNNSNQVNTSQNLAILKQMKAKQQNQIYLEGDLNNFINNQTNIYSYSNNKVKNKMNNVNNIIENGNNNNYFRRTQNVDKAKNNRGMPKKSPIPIPKSMVGKYLNNDNMSKYSTNSNNVSYHTANSQLINNNYSISNLSQISGYSNNSYNNSQINFGAIIDNDHIRSYSNNTNSSIKQKRLNGTNSFNNNNKNIIGQNKSSTNLTNTNNNQISPYTHKVKTNNYINNNINNNNNLNNVISNIGIKRPKFISKSPNPQRGDHLSYTIKKNSNNGINQNNNNFYNNTNRKNTSVLNNTNNENISNKLGYKMTNNFVYTNNNNLNVYNNYKYNNRNDIHYNGRPLTSHSHINKTIRRNNNNNRNNVEMIMNKFDFNPNDININNYNSNETNRRQRMLLNNKNKTNNYIHEYNSHNTKRDYSANNPNNRINIEKINNEYGNNLSNINPMVNLHIINKGQIINNNYNNINNINNNLNNNMNNLYVYKYDISQNNIIQGKYNTNTKEHNNSKRKNKNPIRNNINNLNNLNNINNYSNEELNVNFNNLNNMNKERQNNHKYYKKGIKIRSNSSSGIGVAGELNNILNHRNNEKINQNLMSSKQIDTNKINHLNNFNNNLNGFIKPNPIINNNINIQNIMNQNKKSITKPIRKIHHFTHVGFNGERDKEFNQDIAFLERNFTGNNSYLYLAVCDGHGVEGHEVSGFIKRILPKELSNSLYHKDILTNDKNAKKKIYNTIGETFIRVNEKLISNESINSIFSGTTCVSVIYTPIKLICANIGDSRAVLGKYDKNFKKWIAVNLSRDHKPTEEDEARRIYKKGGRIKPFIDEETGEEVGPQRVWVKDDEVPGLAMTRSFGDRVAAIAGTICLPEIKEYNFSEGDKFLILASDGVWEFIQSEECINIIGKFYLNNNIEGCCEFLYNESKKRWIKEEEVVDDITMLLVFFD